MTAPSNISVLREEYHRSRIRAKRQFNSDFTLWLLPILPEFEDRTAVAIPVRPHTFGADFFVVIRNDGVPALVELIGGESFPRESFTDAIERIDAAIYDFWEGSSAEAEYLRIAELEAGVSFLAANCDVSEMTHLAAARIDSQHGSLYVRSKSNGRMMIDGSLYV
jgi:hypothetical protein